MKIKWCEVLVFVLMLIFVLCFFLAYFDARGSDRSISVEYGTAYEVTAEMMEETDGEKEKQGTRRMDLNTATQSELETLPGIGAVTAENIIQYRTEHDGFSSVEELSNVSGIGGKTLEALREYVTVG